MHMCGSSILVPGQGIGNATNSSIIIVASKTIPISKSHRGGGREVKGIPGESANAEASHEEKPCQDHHVVELVGPSSTFLCQNCGIFTESWKWPLRNHQQRPLRAPPCRQIQA